MKQIIPIILVTCCLTTTQAQDAKWNGKFEQLDYLLPTPNEYRTSSGSPGPAYWQQRADYVINVEVDDDKHILSGNETITYYNNSPSTLNYLWLQLDQNINKDENNPFGYFSQVRDSISGMELQWGQRVNPFDGGFKIKAVKDAQGNMLPYVINNTMLRIDNVNVKSKTSFTFSVEWSYNISDRSQYLLSREGMEYFPEDGNWVYNIALWYPRMCAYDDVQGWQNKQFRGLGEFALTFGNFLLNITVPSDHIVAASGALQNPKDVLSPTELDRFEKAKSSFDKPLFIVTETEAIAKEKTKSTSKKTWVFKADNVRDVAFATSRKFIWDAQAVKLPTNTVLAMSFYPKEGNPIWSEESTKAVKNAVEVYSKYTFDYPYPVAISVNASNVGMEYPMISFNGGRPDKKGKMSDGAKQGMIGTIVHEVGHNYFPMIVSSDERQWMWMDEGLNTFLQTRTEMERYTYPHTRPKNIVPYMKGEKKTLRPIMTTADNVSLFQIGNNAYQKPTVALTILRETVMGIELFDKAFKEYATRWMFKHPKPADFFRTMENASAVDLDWFWKGWFFTIDNVEVEVDEVKWYRVKSEKAMLEGKTQTAKAGDLGTEKKEEKATNFSKGPKEITFINTEDRMYGEFKNRISDAEIRTKLEGKNLYEVKFKNNGGLVTPLIIEWTYKDGTKEIEKIPAEIWRINENEVSKVFVKDKEVVTVVFDPKEELADVNTANNVFPKKPMESKFDQFKKGN